MQRFRSFQSATHSTTPARPSFTTLALPRHALLGSTLACLIGLSTASHAAIEPGTLRITEIMTNPAAVSDTLGEWFEIHNTSGNNIDLSGLTLTDLGSNSHSLDNLTIAAGAYLVLGRNADPLLNGGVPVDYVYNNFTLSNSSDAIILSEGSTVIDSVIYTDGSLFGVAGNSVELTANGFALTPAGISTLGPDIGTPGAAGSYTPPGVAPVPVPAAGWLFGSALASLAWRKRSNGSAGRRYLQARPA